MISKDAKLREDIFHSPEQIPTRDGFGQGLMMLGEQNPQVVVICADLAESTRVLGFKERFPERYIEAGVAEQNMATIASGLANYGKIPFITSYASFSPGRNNEQIRTTIALNNVAVKIIGMHAGVSVGPDGATHQALEDVALMRILPHMTVISPCDAEEGRKATLAAALAPGPVYVRFWREKTPVLTTTESPFILGKAQIVWDSPTPQAVIFATGPLLYNALLAAQELQNDTEVLVVNVHTIKPLDTETLLACARKTGAVVTVEEHQIAGGMGSAIAELLASEYPVPMEFIGVHDQFGQSGKPQELLTYYGMDTTSIVNAVRRAIQRKTAI